MTGEADQPADAAFVWPPRASPSPPDAPQGTQHLPRPAQLGTSPSPRRAATLIRTTTATTALAFERTMLGLHSPPWAVRAAEGEFEPDPDHAYCPRCAGPVGPFEVSSLDTNPGCGACQGQKLPWSRAVRLGPWSGALRQAILEAKYARWRRLAFDLGQQLGQVLSRRLLEAGLEPQHVALVPVPMSFRRRWSRGLDHTLAIARGIRRVTRSPIERPLRRHHRPPQASLPEGARSSNVRGCFSPGVRARSSTRLADYPAIVVIDDVRTSGATLRSMCRALIAAERRRGSPLDPTTIWVATLAVVTPTNRRIESGLDVVEDEGVPQESRVSASTLNF